MASQAIAEKRKMTAEAHARLTDELGGRPPTIREMAEAMDVRYYVARARCRAMGLAMTPASRVAGAKKWTHDGIIPAEKLKIERAHRKRLARKRALAIEGELPLSSKYLRRLDDKISEWRSRVPPGLI